VVLIVVPPEETLTVPLSVVLLIVPPAKTLSVPPKSTVSPISVWPKGTL
jgi:hypothetical protein